MNVSNQDVTVCEGTGVCVGASVDATYELGGFASSPNGYTFSFGDGSDPSAGFLDGKASGTYAPGQEEELHFQANTPPMVVSSRRAPMASTTNCRYSRRRLTAR